MSVSNAEIAAEFERLNVLDTPIWLYDIDAFAMRWANTSAVKLWGAPSLEQLLARNFADISDATRIRLNSYREGFAQGKTFVERWTFYPGGKPMVTDCHCAGVRLPGYDNIMVVEGKPVGLVSGEHDALRMVEALRHTQVMISLYSKDGTPLMRNPAGIKMFGQPDAGSDSLWNHFVHGSDVEDMKATLAAGRVWSAEIEQKTLHGIRWLGVDARVTSDPATGDEVILLNKIDISRRKAAEEMREKALIEAENANSARFRFIANVSHELRTPMNAVIGMSELLLGTELDDRQLHYVETVQSSGESLLNIINDLLDYSKIDAGHLKLQKEPYDLVGRVQAVVDIVGVTQALKPVTITTEIAPDFPRFLLGDGNRIKQILLNLIGNAVKFTPEGEVTVRVNTAGDHGERLRVEVEDTGIGIAEQDLPKLFQSFSQIDNRNARPYSGTGLGLAISKLLVDMMQGSIGVSSQLGAGSLFWFELPLQEAKGVELPSPAPLVEEMSVPMRPLEVLLAEDNEVNQRLVTIMLGKLGHKTRIAGDGAEAVAAAQEQRFDIILMDVQMPGVDGLMATRSIRASSGPNATSPIVALTANAMEGDEQLCLEAGMDGYLTKPVSMARLAGALRRYAR